MQSPEFVWEHAASVVEPHINAEGSHVWPFDSSFPVDVRFFILGGPHQTRMNRHDYYEVAYLCSGVADFQIQERQFRVSKGDMMVIGSGLYHRIASSLPKPARLAVLYFEPGLICGTENSGDDAEYLMPFSSQDSSFPHVIKPEARIPAEIFSMIQRLKEQLPATSRWARLTVKTYLKMILVTLINHYKTYTGAQNIFTRQQAAHGRLRPLFEYMNEHYNEPLQIYEAARLCAMSSSHFMDFFRRTTGQSFLTYLTHFRIAKAQQLLASTEMSISGICQDLGFCNQSYFGMVFRKVVGLTPLHFRRKFNPEFGAEPRLSPDFSETFRERARIYAYGEERIPEAGFSR